jgi:hypothetical protein
VFLAAYCNFGQVTDNKRRPPPISLPAVWLHGSTHLAGQLEHVGCLASIVTNPQREVSCRAGWTGNNHNQETRRCMEGGGGGGGKIRRVGNYDTACFITSATGKGDQFTLIDYSIKVPEPRCRMSWACCEGAETSCTVILILLMVSQSYSFEEAINMVCSIK